MAQGNKFFKIYHNDSKVSLWMIAKIIMHITKFSPPNIPTTKNKNARIGAERRDKKSIENGIPFPSIQNAAYTVLFKELSIIYFSSNRDRYHFSGDLESIRNHRHNSCLETENTRSAFFISKNFTQIPICDNFQFI